MKRIILIGLIGILMAGLLCGSASAAITGSGNSWSDPYVIHNAADLRLLSGTGYAGYAGNNKYFILNGEIDFTNDNTLFTPIGTNQYKFNGHFDGKGHRITGLKTSSSPSGLFMYVTSGAELKNIDFYNAQITGTEGGCAGVLYGMSLSATSQISVNNVNVYNSKVTASGTHVGVLVGEGADVNSHATFTSCTVKDCVITSSVGNGVGVLAGVGAVAHSQATFTSCHVTGCVITSSITGGVGVLVGIGTHTYCQATITSCTVKDCVIVSSNGDGIGILAGYGANTNSQVTAQSCNVENCYVYAKSSYVGGIFGIGTSGTDTTCTITNCDVLKSTIRADTSYAGGIYGAYRKNGGQPTVSGCTVTDCTVIASSYDGGITGGYSSS